MWSYLTSTTRSGRSGTNDRSFCAFHRLCSASRGVRVPSSCAAQAHGWPSKEVTSGWSSAKSSRRFAIGKAPMTPMLCSDPSSVCSPSSSEPTASGPDLCTR